MKDYKHLRMIKNNKDKNMKQQQPQYQFCYINLVDSHFQNIRSDPKMSILGPQTN